MKIRGSAGEARLETAGHLASPCVEPGRVRAEILSIENDRLMALVVRKWKRERKTTQLRAGSSS